MIERIGCVNRDSVSDKTLDSLRGQFLQLKISKRRDQVFLQNAGMPLARGVLVGWQYVGVVSTIQCNTSHERRGEVYPQETKEEDV